MYIGSTYFNKKMQTISYQKRKDITNDTSRNQNKKIVFVQNITCKDAPEYRSFYFVILKK